MSDNWEKVRLGEICEYRSEKININGIKLDAYISTTNMLPNKEGVTKLDELPSGTTVNMYFENDILISNIRPYFKKIWFADKNGSCSSDVLVFKLKNINNYNISTRYLYYVLFNDGFFEHMMAGSKGTKMPRGNKTQILDYKFNLPPLETQEKIANILSALDDKIENNKKTAVKLEEMAQTLFNRWFVEFNFPNENGLPYKDNGGEMVESELGLIPKGWEVLELGNIIDFKNGYAFSSKVLIDIEELETYKVFKMGNIKLGGGINKEKTKSYIKKDKCIALEKFLLKKGDILMCMTDMKNSGTPLLGHTALMDCDDEFIVNQRVGVIKCKKDIVNYPYLYTLTNSGFFIDELRSKANSGVQVNLTTKGICETLVVIPSKKYHDSYNSIVETIYNQTFILRNENEKLRTIQNYLLSKLMSGEMEL